MNLLYQTVLDYLNSLTFFERPGFNSYISIKGKKQGVSLERQKKLLQLLNNPEKHKKVILVAGTSGKGSVSTMLAHILASSGKKTGLHVSPHLSTPRERIWINGKNIEKSAFVETFTPVWEAAKRVHQDTKLGMPSYYEIILAMALQYFHAQQVEYVVLEAGLGGKLDGINAIQRPVLSIITPIDKDHVDVLGRTLTAIASDKACIIRPKSGLVIAKQRPIVMKSISAMAQTKDVKPIVVHHPEHIGVTGLGKTTFSWDGNEFVLPLTGKHFALNAAIALEAARYLNVDISNARKSFQNITLPGRSEVIEGKPKIILDAAHNPHKVAALVESLRGFNLHRLGLVFTAMSDKDARTMLTELSGLDFKKIWLTKSLYGPRTVFPLADLHKYAGKITNDISITYSPQEALDELTKSNLDTVLVTGSMYFVGELRELLMKKHKISGD